MSIADTSNGSRICLVKSAAALFSRFGLDKCSTRDIAKDSQSNISLISYYFGGKEGLYREVMKSYALSIKNEVQDLVDSFDNTEITKEIFVQDLEKVIGHLIDSRANNPEVSKILAREKLDGMPHSKEIFTEIFYPLTKKFFKRFEVAQKKGFVKPGVHPVLFFMTLTEAIWGFYSALECDTPIGHECVKIAADRESFKKQVLDIYLTGVLL